MSTEEKEGKARNEEIENQLKRDKMMQRNEIKMLLLGQSLPQLPIIINRHILNEIMQVLESLASPLFSSK